MEIKRFGSILLVKDPAEEVVYMEISNEKIDSGKAFEWGKTSANYARYRDIYPRSFMRKS